jgi:hypothetical protein
VRVMARGVAAVLCAAGALGLVGVGTASAATLDLDQQASAARPVHRDFCDDWNHRGNRACWSQNQWRWDGHRWHHYRWEPRQHRWNER